METKDQKEEARKQMLDIIEKNQELTKDQTWEDRFDLMEKNHGWIPEHKERIKSFISKVRSEAIKETKEKMLADSHTCVASDLVLLSNPVQYR